jgi:CBS domain-containing protein
MKVQNLMSSPARTCADTADLGAAAKAMLEHNCGCLPVVDPHGHVVGMITDRDVCAAVVARHQSPWHIPVHEAMTSSVVSCSPSDDVTTAMTSMSKHHVRRLPVIDSKRHLQGIISVDDIVQRAGKDLGQVPADAVVRMLRVVCAPRVVCG